MHATDGRTAAPVASAGDALLELRLGPLGWGMAIATLCLVVFVASQPTRYNFYVHFVWQVQAWLDGQTSIPTHVQGSATSPGNYYYQDVMPLLNGAGKDAGRGIIPFPPLPALFLLPFAAIWHLRTNEQLLASIFGAIDVGLAYWMLGYLPIPPAVRRLTALFFGLGTVLWYASVIGTTWFWAHVVAVFCLLPAVGLALSADRAAVEPEERSGRSLGEALLPRSWPGGAGSFVTLVAAGTLGLVGYAMANRHVPVGQLLAVSAALCVLAVLLAAFVGGLRPTLTLAAVLAVAAAFVVSLLLTERAPLALVAFAVAALAVAAFAVVAPGPADRVLQALADVLGMPEARQLLAGFLFGLAVTARLTILFGFPFFLLVGGGGSWLRRGLLAGAGAAIPGVVLLAYTYAGTGNLFNPAYDYLYQREAAGYWWLNYHASWAISDLRYVPQNLNIFLFSLPEIMPKCDAPGMARGWFNQACPYAMPNEVGMSLILTSPAYLFAPFAFVVGRLGRLDRVTLGAAIAVVAIAFANLMHFSQGWVQFGYRFSNDFVPFALLLVALGAARLGRRWLWPFAALVVASIAVNLWGTAWGVINGW